MASAALDRSELSRQCGEEVSEIYIIIAKHEVLDLEAKTIGDLLGVSQVEIEELQKDELYKKVLMLLKAQTSRARVDTELGYDMLENMAVTRLLERVPLERDGDFLLKVAAMANRAQRRTKPIGILDPAAAGVRVPLTLTARSVKRLHSDGTQEIEETRQVRLANGHSNPTFADVDSLLSVSVRPPMDQKMRIETQTVGDPTVEQLIALEESDGW